MYSNINLKEPSNYRYQYIELANHDSDSETILAPNPLLSFKTTVFIFLLSSLSVGEYTYLILTDSSIHHQKERIVYFFSSEFSIFWITVSIFCIAFVLFSALLLHVPVPP